MAFGGVVRFLGVGSRQHRPLAIYITSQSQGAVLGVLSFLLLMS